MPVAAILLLAAAPQMASTMPVAAQERATAEPLPLFDAVCVNGSARLSKKIATPVDYGVLPEGARRALGASTVTTRAEAEKLPAPDAASVTDTIYRVGDGQLYLLVPGTAASQSVLANSCIVLWHAMSDEDYASARHVVLPNEDAMPLIARPTSSALGAATVSVTRDGGATLTASAFSGWVALRSALPAPQPTGAQ